MHASRTTLAVVVPRIHRSPTLGSTAMVMVCTVAVICCLGLLRSEHATHHVTSSAPPRHTSTHNSAHELRSPSPIRGERYSRLHNQASAMTCRNWCFPCSGCPAQESNLRHTDALTVLPEEDHRHCC